MPVIEPATEEVNCTPRLTCDVSEFDRMAGVSEVENRLTPEGAVVTARLNVSLADRPPKSVTDVLTLRVPALVDVGVPLKVRVVASKVSHAGSAVPSAAVAV